MNNKTDLPFQGEKVPRKAKPKQNKWDYFSSFKTYSGDLKRRNCLLNLPLSNVSEMFLVFAKKLHLQFPMIFAEYSTLDKLSDSDCCKVLKISEGQITAEKDISYISEFSLYDMFGFIFYEVEREYNLFPSKPTEYVETGVTFKDHNNVLVSKEHTWNVKRTPNDTRGKEIFRVKFLKNGPKKMSIHAKLNF